MDLDTTNLTLLDRCKEVDEVAEIAAPVELKCRRTRNEYKDPSPPSPPPSPPLPSLLQSVLSEIEANSWLGAHVPVHIQKGQSELGETNKHNELWTAIATWPERL